MRALVTGGAGFIGSHIVDRLLADGHEVRVLDDFSTGKESNLPDDARLHVIRGDVGDFDTVASAVAGVDWVFHEAAVASVPKTLEDPLGSHRTNYVGTLNVLEASRRADVKRVMFAASAAAYGDEATPPHREDMPVNPLSPYAVDKVASEHICSVYHRLYGLETVCLRYFNVFGPRQDPSSPYSGVISIFAECLKEGRRPTIYGDGKQTRDFVCVGDVVDANMKAAITPGIDGRLFNIGTGQAITLNRLLVAIENVWGAGSEPAYEEPRIGDIRDSAADVSRAAAELGWSAKIGLEAGLRILLASAPASG
ncbi:MAG: SDR family oxidoreductase [Gammaproteobacteria bacterium]